MLLLRFMVLVLIIFVIRIVKTEEISSSTTTKVVAGSFTENNITLENLITSTSTLSSLINLNNLNEGATTSSWELIYPDRNTTTATMEPSTTSANKKFSTTETSTGLFPKYFKVDDVTNCQKYFGECLRQVLTNVFPKFKNGHQALNTPSIDPIYFNQTAFQFNNGGPFTGHITIRYAHIYGLTTMKFKKLDFYKLENKKFKTRFNINVPKMKAIGSYKGDLLINNVRVRPRGDFNVTMLGLQMDLLCLGSIYKGEEEHTFLKFTKNNVTTMFRDSKINVTGIFPDQRLTEIVVNVANQYWRELFNVVLPETRNYWSPILLGALNEALAMVPFDFLN